jgi:hypothetical protein
MQRMGSSGPAAHDQSTCAFAEFSAAAPNPAVRKRGRRSSRTPLMLATAGTSAAGVLHDHRLVDAADRSLVGWTIWRTGVCGRISDVAAGARVQSAARSFFNLGHWLTRSAAGVAAKTSVWTAAFYSVSPRGLPAASRSAIAGPKYLVIPAACAGAEIVSGSNSVAVQARMVMRAGLQKRSVIMAVSLSSRGNLVLFRFVLLHRPQGATRSLKGVFMGFASVLPANDMLTTVSNVSCLSAERFDGLRVLGRRPAQNRPICSAGHNRAVATPARRSGLAARDQAGGVPLMVRWDGERVLRAAGATGRRAFQRSP